jgi:hypothetical protein
MHDETFEEITGSLVRSYGPVQVYTLMQMRSDDLVEETDKHHLIVLVDEQEKVTAAIWHYDSRIDLPWIVYAIKRYLSIRTRMVDETAKSLEGMRQPENMAKIQANFDRAIAAHGWDKDPSTYLSAERFVERQQFGLDRLRTDRHNIAEALREVEAMHPEGIQNVTDEASAEHERQMQRINEGRRKAEAWRPYVGKGIRDYHSFLGPHVLHAGPFHVYQNMGVFGRLDLHSGIEFEGGSNVPYMILFEDETLGTFDIATMHFRYVPDPLQVCRPARSWFAQLSHSIDAATKAIEEASNPEETQHIREALIWRKRIYLAVYDAWVALGCPGAPDDNPDPTFDPTTAAGFGTFRSGIEPSRSDSQP